MSPTHRLALLLCVPICVVVTTKLDARADDADQRPCEKEMEAVVALNPIDRALASPTDPTAAGYVKEANDDQIGTDYDGAIKNYTAAWKAQNAPVILYNLGQAYRAKKDYETAIRQYRLFIDRGDPGPEVRALVQCHIRTMKNEMEGAAATAPPTGPAPDGVAGTGTAPRLSMPAPWYADKVGWAASGGGAIFSVVGVVLLLGASDLDAQADREDQDLIRRELRDQASTRRLWGGLATAVGVVGVTVGIIKLIMVPDAKPLDEPQSERGLSLVIGSGGHTIGLAGTF